MVCSQVYSQYPSQCALSNVQQHRSWVPDNAEVHCLEPETSEGNWLGNTDRDGNLWSFKGNAYAGYVNSPSPLNSSWIQRLIPSHNTRVEQPEFTENFTIKSHGIDGVQIDLKENAAYRALTGNQADFSLCENSRRSMQDYFNGDHTYLGTSTTHDALIGVNVPANSRQFEPSQAMQPEVQVSPTPLPVVESLLPGSFKRVFDNQTWAGTNKSHILSKCKGFSNQVKQTIHFSADERFRVSCSSIERLNSQFAAKDLLAVKSVQAGKSRINPSQSDSDFPLNGADAVTMSKMRTYLNPPQVEDPFVTLHTKSRYLGSQVDWASSVGRCKSVLVDGHLMPYRAEGIGRFPECSTQANRSTAKTDERSRISFGMDQTTYPKTVGKRDLWHAKEHNCEDGDSFASEALNARGDAVGGGWLIPNRKKDGARRVSDLGLSHYEANITKKRAGTSLSHHMVEQEVSSSHNSREEHGGTSRSFSFQFADQLSYHPDSARVVSGKGNWPFCPTTLSSEDLVQSKSGEESRAKVLAEVTRPRASLKDSSSFREIGAHDTETVYITRSRCSPFFGTENVSESAMDRLSVKDDISHYKASCTYIKKERCSGEMNTDAVHGNGVDQTGGIQQEKVRSLKGAHIFSRSGSDLVIEEMEGKELKYLHPLRTFSVNDWKRPEPSIRSTIRTPVGAQLKQADGNLCYSAGSIGSCSKGPTNLFSEDPFTTGEARSSHTTHKRPETLTPAVVEKHLYSSKTQSADNELHVAGDGRKSEGREVVGCKGSVVRQNMWLQRWSTTESRKVQVGSKLNRERMDVTSLPHTRNFVEKCHCASEGSRESSHCSDLRPVKRLCYERKSGLLQSAEPGKATSKMGTLAMAKDHSESHVVSHFMKRFTTPSAAAMAVMGMTARAVHAAQPQRRGLFGVWALNASIRRPPPAQAEMCKKFSTRPNLEEPSAAIPSPTPVDG